MVKMRHSMREQAWEALSARARGGFSLRIQVTSLYSKLPVFLVFTPSFFFSLSFLVPLWVQAISRDWNCGNRVYPSI